MCKLRLRDALSKWNKFCDWFVPVVKGKSIKSTIRRAYVSALVYVIWQKRNRTIYHHRCRTPLVPMRIIESELYIRFGYSLDSIL